MRVAVARKAAVRSRCRYLCVRLVWPRAVLLSQSVAAARQRAVGTITGRRSAAKISLLCQPLPRPSQWPQWPPGGRTPRVALRRRPAVGPGPLMALAGGASGPLIRRIFDSVRCTCTRLGDALQRRPCPEDCRRRLAPWCRSSARDPLLRLACSSSTLFRWCTGPRPLHPRTPSSNRHPLVCSSVRLDDARFVRRALHVNSDPSGPNRPFPSCCPRWGLYQAGEPSLVWCLRACGLADVVISQSRTSQEP